MKKIYFVLFILWLATGSCSDWFDVKSQVDLKEDEIFNHENGFFDVLTGVYATLASSDLYGNQLTMCFLDILACNYQFDNQAAPLYRAMSEYNYTHSAVQPIIDQIWSKMYTAIANVNKLLERLDKTDPNLFSNDNYHLIKGEALALRAFIHFDLLRMFGPSMAMDAERKCIPYVTRYGIENTPYGTTREILEYILQDLDQAVELLQNDPVLTPFDQPASVYLTNRNLHLNIHAVKGMIARVCLYAGHKERAYETATDIISNQKKFTLVSDPRICENDKLFSGELLFALYIDELAKTAEMNYPAISGNYTLGNDEDRLYSIYEYATYRLSDVRLEFLFSKESDGSWRLRKFLQESTDNRNSKLRMPILRLSELYYIAAECAPDLPTAENLVNDVRIARRLPKTGFQDKEELETYLLAEYRKEMYAEGQLFYLYKRKNLSAIPDCTVNVQDHMEETYIFPLPQQERDWGNK